MNINLTLLMQAVAFAAFIWFTARFVWPPLMRAIETRQKQIADGIAAGEQARQSLASAETRVSQMLTEAKSRAAEITALAEKQSAKILDEAREAAKLEGDRIIASARGEIEQEVSRAKDMLRTQVAELAVAGARRILQREVDAKAHAELLAGLTREL